jgi:hypothetical protein
LEKFDSLIEQRADFWLWDNQWDEQYGEKLSYDNWGDSVHCFKYYRPSSSNFERFFGWEFTRESSGVFERGSSVGTWSGGNGIFTLAGFE